MEVVQVGCLRGSSYTLGGLGVGVGLVTCFCILFLGGDSSAKKRHLDKRALAQICASLVGGLKGRDLECRCCTLGCHLGRFALRLPVTGLDFC